MKQFEYVRKNYGVPAKRGMRVEIDGKPGVITSDGGAHIRVRLDGSKHSGFAHPTWRVTYFTDDGPVRFGYPAPTPEDSL